MNCLSLFVLFIMPVNIPPLHADQLLPVAGVTLGVAECGIKQLNRKDLLVMVLDEGAHVAGVFTQNQFYAAPVHVAKAHLSEHAVRALVVNTGNANAGTGETGLAHAHTMCSELAKILGCEANQVLPFSTGVIMESLPIEQIVQGLPVATNALKPNNWFAAAQAILTTDIVAKAVSKQIQLDNQTVTITGISKGSGMIHPNMATMLGYIATDAAISQLMLDKMIQHAVRHSFNCITVDGDTSTNDSFILIATGQAGHAEIIDPNTPIFVELQDAITDVAIQLAQMIVRDGEGATKFITIKIEGGRDDVECRQVAEAIAHSPLVKTAFFASDPNLGRILAAIGNSGVADLDVNKIRLYLDNVLVAEQGGPAPEYVEQDGFNVMQQSEFTVRVELARGDACASVWTCDLSYEYVRINADYRS